MSEEVCGTRIWPQFPPDGRRHVAARLRHFDRLPALTGGALFLGDSITEDAPLPIMFPDVQTLNFGISWDTTDGLLTRLHQAERHRPEHIFVLIGTNDTDYNYRPDHIAENILEIARRLEVCHPHTDIHVLSILPRDVEGNMSILPANRIVREKTETMGIYFIDITSRFEAEDGTLRRELTGDGLHLNAAGYELLGQLLRPVL